MRLDWFKGWALPEVCTLLIASLVCLLFTLFKERQIQQVLRNHYWDIFVKRPVCVMVLWNTHQIQITRMTDKLLPLKLWQMADLQSLQSKCDMKLKKYIYWWDKMWTHGIQSHTTYRKQACVESVSSFLSNSFSCLSYLSLLFFLMSPLSCLLSHVSPTVRRMVNRRTKPSGTIAPR